MRLKKTAREIKGSLVNGSRLELDEVQLRRTKTGAYSFDLEGIRSAGHERNWSFQREHPDNWDSKKEVLMGRYLTRAEIN
ncbi:MAG: hypothetical protein ABIV51_02075 [Saprospiraceae bacterium]